MKKIVKQVVGIDVAQDELVVCAGHMSDDWAPELFAQKSFPNTNKGFEALQAWVKKIMEVEVAVRYVMEATGVYHEKLAYYLAKTGCLLSIVLPNKISSYCRTLDVKTVTDKTASQAIALFGLERQLREWQPPSPVFRSLRQLTRERDQLVGERTIVKNQLHAETSGAQPGMASVKRMKTRIELLDKQIAEIKGEIREIVKGNENIKTSINMICSIPGIGELTAVTILAETNGFELIRNKRQLASYAGLDIKEKQSGTSVRGKSTISKRGNKYLRKAMHMPALSAIGHDERFKAIFARLVAKHGIKMKAAVAVQRRLLEMVYTIYKTGKHYEKNYLQKMNQKIEILS